MKLPTINFIYFIISLFFYSSQALAQMGDCVLIYGNKDTSTINVRLGQVIGIQAWGATAPENIADSVTFIHMPLGTDDLIVAERQGGFFPDTLIGEWDDVEFLSPNVMEVPGFSSQSLLGFAYLTNPRDDHNFFITFGDTVLMCTYLMRLTDNRAYADSTVSPFIEGHHQDNGPTLWGAGIPSCNPMISFSKLHFVVCDSDPGDANADWQFNGLDVIYCVNYLKGIGPEPPCVRVCPPFGNVYFRADSNGNCAFNGLDITYSVNYLKGLGPAPAECVSCL